MKLLILNGPNLNIILKRNKDFYGSLSLEQIEKELNKQFPEISLSFINSNSEYELVKVIQQSEDNFDGLIINPGAFSHSSIAIRDALEICKIPKIEVHLSNLASRDEFRNNYITGAQCDGYISGFKNISYFSAVFTMKMILENKTGL